ncbi:hypothetical protein DL95DRAFT_454425 [Leptodontidium sp. 2 PMI_412]|nr:hypothetical protein DL95DRAFT_454425 [Leptodontidium sp. 2 PMI_412]
MLLSWLCQPITKPNIISMFILGVTSRFLVLIMSWNKEKDCPTGGVSLCLGGGPGADSAVNILVADPGDRHDLKEAGMKTSNDEEVAGYGGPLSEKTVDVG